MKNVFIAAILCLTSMSALAQSDPRVAREEALQSVKQQARGRIVPNFSSSCQVKSLGVPGTASASLSIFSCIDPILGVYEDVYAISGVAGQKIHIDYSSTQFDVFLWMSPLVLPTRVSFLDSSNHGTSRDTLDYTFTVSKTYYIEAEALFVPGFGLPATGAYTLAVTTSGGGNCTANATTLCLNNNRFAVSVAWKDFNNNTGTGKTIPMTSDTGSFWFFGETNYELMVKVLDARTLNNRFWVFYGALSTVEYTITVKDTVTNKTKTYFNKSGNLGSVADTDAFTP